MSRPRRCVLLILALLAGATGGCGADRLPPFANPPALDGGAAGDSADDDAG